MFSLSFVILLGLPSLLIARLAWSWNQNIRIAKASGLPYVAIPIYTHNVFYRALHKPILAFIDKWVPRSWTDSWRSYADPEWPWTLRYLPFEKIGSDTFLLAAPAGLILYTADADVIVQTTSRRHDFPKAVEIYGGLDIYGKNVVTTEGNAWRHHRKVTAPPFTEKNNHLVWQATIQQTQRMLDSWTGPDGNMKGTVRRMAQDTMRLSLNVICRAGFGKEMSWPKSEDSTNAFAEDEVPEGHAMSYALSLHTILHNFVITVIFPIWLLRSLPLKATKRLVTAYEEWGSYMEEMLAKKRSAIEAGNDSSTIDLLGQMAQVQVGGVDGKAGSGPTLSNDEIMGNAFVFMLAGHETTANSINFSTMLLALHPQSQRRMQKELEDIFQGRPTSEWDYDRDVPRLFGGMVGAVMNEELCMIPPAPVIPKTVRPHPQAMVVDGKKVTFPVTNDFALVVPAVHRNPKYWPHGPARDPKKAYFPPTRVDNDLEEFKPERWLKQADTVADAAPKPSMSAGNNTAETDELGINTASDTAASLFTPPRGAFVPFSEGYRACLGRRFAQVEILAALAVIFSEYTAELAVDEWATDEEVEKMSREEKREVWRKAEAKSNDIWQNKMKNMITLQIRGAHIPFRFVKKGSERFANIWD